MDEAMTYATVFTFDSQQTKDKGLEKNANPPVIYYAITASYYYLGDDGYWTLLSKAPKFIEGSDTVIFYFIDSAQQVTQPGAAVEFQQAISPFNDEVAAEMRLAAPVKTSFQTSETVSQTAFMLPLRADPDDPPAQGDGYSFESTGKYSYTVTLITFPDLRKYWLDPEMDVEP